MTKDVLSSPKLYSKQNKVLNFSSINVGNPSWFLETNKYHLVFLHPEPSEKGSSSKTTKYKSLFIPAYNIDQPPMVGSTPVQIPYGGEITYYSPSTTGYVPMQVTLIDDESLKVRTYLQELLLSFARPTSKTRLMQVGIIIYDHNGEYLVTIELFNAFISSIGPIDLSWQAPSQIATFSVTIEFSYFNTTNNEYGFEENADYFNIATELFKI